MRLERGTVSVDGVPGSALVHVSDGPATVLLTLEDLRWLILCAGPAVLCELQEAIQEGMVSDVRKQS